MTTNDLPCLHGRSSWRSCPHCLGLNKTLPGVAEVQRVQEELVNVHASCHALLKERDATIEELKKQITCLREWGERDERGRKAAEKDLAAANETIEALRKELKELQDWRTGKKGIEDYYTLKAALAAAKERAENLLRLIDNFVRFRTGDYVGWSKAGGPGECKHGYAAGLPCPDCTMAEARKLLAEREGRKVLVDGVDGPDIHNEGANG